MLNHMKSASSGKNLIYIFAICVFALFVINDADAQVPNKISYQGLLTTSAGTPVPDGSYDLTFKIFNVSTGGSALWTENQTGITVQRGTFNVFLGSVTTIDISFNQTLYVEVTATSGPGIPSPIIFSPRSELTSSPYSFSVIGTQCEATGLYSTAGGRNNRARGNYSVVGGGGGATAADSNSALGDNSTVGGGRYNFAIRYYSTVGGGFANSASGGYAVVSGGSNNTASEFWSTIGGGSNNTASGAAATVSGGSSNTASEFWSTIGGGYINTASGTAATVSGGSNNQASNDRATVGGGTYNYASGKFATVSGGWSSRARGSYSFVGGGGGFTIADSNSAIGDWSVIPGGRTNKAAGSYSFAAGRRAKAEHDGAFVWADQTDADFASSAINQFNIRASGGTRIFSNTALTAGVTLAAGASAWAAVSDSSLKHNKRLVNTNEILEKVSRLPIMRWSYLSQDPSIEHIGPMAQDFYALFGLGEDEKTISTIDPAGVALAAIQELAKQNQELRIKNEELTARINQLEIIVQSLAEEKKSTDNKSLGELR